MDLKSAYNILGLQTNASESDVKKAFRNLSKTYHPDNKDTGNADKYKEITAAYNFINNPSEHEKMKQNQESNPFQGFGGFGGFGGFDFIEDMGFNKKQKFRKAEHIIKNVTLTFEESILGKNIKIDISRNKACEDCSGEGSIEKNNGCQVCGGRGKKVIQQANFITVSNCTSCKGPTIEDCKKCNGDGTIRITSNYDVKIPGGVVNDNVLKMQNSGNFIGNMHGMLLHSDILIQVKVTPKKGFSLENNIVKTSKNISLLDALKGCKVKVDTVLGEKEITINKNTKTNDVVVINKVGVNGNGPQHVTIHVDYPKETQKLIDFLENYE